MSKIDKVVKAIRETVGSALDDGLAYKAARAAIKELRRPDTRMLEVGCKAHPHEPYSADTSLADIIEAEWKAMLDEALKTP